MWRSQVFQTETEGSTLIVTTLENVSNLMGNEIGVEIDRLLQQFRQGGLTNVVVDLGKAEYFGSYMLEVMNRLWRQVRGKRGRMSVCNASDFGKEVLHVTRLDTLWPVCDARDEAIRVVSQ